MTSAEKAELTPMDDRSPVMTPSEVDLQPRNTKTRLVKSIVDVLAMPATLCRRTTAGIFRDSTTSRRMVVGSTASVDNSIIVFSNHTREMMGLRRKDIVYVTNNQGKTTILVSILDDDLEDGFVHMNWVARENLSVRLGDTVTVDQCPDPRYLERVVILPIADTFGDLEGSPLDLLAPYFYGAFRPLKKGDVFTCHVETSELQFRVLEADPPSGGIVAQNTTISCDAADLMPGGPTSRTPGQKCGWSRIASSGLRVLLKTHSHTLQSSRKIFRGKQGEIVRSCSSSREALLTES